MQVTQFLSLINTIARMDLKAESSRYYLGYLWWIVEPLLYVCVFYLVFHTILQSPKEDFLLFLICGKLPFIWFSKSVTSSASSIVTNSGLIASTDLPKAIFPLARIQENGYKQCSVFLLLLLFSSILGPVPNIGWLWLVPLILVNYIMIVACALLASYLVCFFRDTERLIGLLMIFLMFCSGIFWDVRDIADAQTASIFLLFNPLAFLLDGYRQVLMYENSVSLTHLLGLLAFFGGACVILLSMMHRHSRLLALRALGA